jgi:hypothetical protein
MVVMVTVSPNVVNKARSPPDPPGFLIWPQVLSLPFIMP